MAASSTQASGSSGSHAATAQSANRSWATWFGVTGGLVLWGAHHGISYGLAAWFVCGQSGRLVLLGATLIAAALVGSAMLVSWRGWKRAGNGFESDLHGDGNVNGFLGLLGMATGLLALTGIAYNGLSAIFFSASC